MGHITKGMDKDLQNLIEDFTKIFHDPTEISKITSCKDITPYGIKYLTEDTSTSNNYKTNILIFKDISGLLDRLIYYIIDKHYQLKQQRDVKLYFPILASKLNTLVVKYPNAFSDVQLKNKLVHIINFCPDVNDLAKYAHNYREDIVQNDKYDIIKPANDNVTILDNGCAIRNFSFHVCIPETSVNSYVNPQNNIDTQKLFHNCYDTIRSLLDHLKAI